MKPFGNFQFQQSDNTQNLIKLIKSNKTEVHRAEILFVNPLTRSIIVKDESIDAPNIYEVPITPKFIDADTSFGTNESLPKEGMKVYLGFEDGYPKILHSYFSTTNTNTVEEVQIRRKVTNVNTGNRDINGMVEDRTDIETGHSHTGGEFFGSNDPIYKKFLGVGSDYSGNSFEDLVAGDHVISTKDGNLIGVLEGGVNYFKASELCQIIGLKINDLLRIVSRNYEHFTDFGTISILNEKGQTSYVLEGSSSALSSRSGQYNLRVYAGAKGDIFKLAVTTSDGNEMFVLHVSNDGKLNLITQGTTENVYGNKSVNVIGSEDIDINGNSNAFYRQLKNETIYGSRTELITNDGSTNIGQYEAVTVGKDSNKTIGGVRNETVAGMEGLTDPAMLEDKDTDKLIINYGNKFEEIKNKGNFIRKTAEGKLDYNITGGDINLKVTQGGRYFEGGNYNLTVNDKVFITHDITGLTSYENPKIVMNFKPDGEIIVQNDNVLIDIFNDGKVNIDANGNTIDMTPAGIKIKEVSGGELNLSNNKVALGINSLELLQQISDQLAKVISFCSTAQLHIHTGNLGYSTSPPVDPSPWVTLSSECGIIKANVDTIKGSL